MTRVRAFEPADLDAVARLFDAYRQFNGKPADELIGRAFLRRRLGRGESILFVAQADDRAIAGFTQLFPTFSSVSLARVFIVNDLYVDPAYRRLGIGSALLQAAAQYARDVGCVRLSASTAIENVPTQILNERNGFVRDQSYFVYHMHTPGAVEPDARSIRPTCST